VAPLGLAAWYLIAVALPVGSCVRTVIDRLPAEKAALTARGLVPLASRLARSGRCRHCGGWLCDPLRL
jgi:prepilin signal peptidase PulO-like enzyme (type II secretory pathway)